MTTEEKAKRIALDKQSGKASGYIDTFLTAYESAMEMAKWKEKQFNMIIEKIIDLFDKYPSNAVFSKNNVIKMFETFKKAMEE